MENAARACDTLATEGYESHLSASNNTFTCQAARAMVLDLADMQARRALSMKNWEFFGAPHAAFLSYPETMHRANAIDIGIFMQTIMLLFVERGIASCPQGALATYPGPVKAMLPIPEGNAILCGLSFGYPDMDAQINSAAARMDREPVDVFASFTS